MNLTLKSALAVFGGIAIMLAGNSCSGQQQKPRLSGD